MADIDPGNLLSTSSNTAMVSVKANDLLQLYKECAGMKPGHSYPCLRTPANAPIARSLITQLAKKAKLELGDVSVEQTLPALVSILGRLRATAKAQKNRSGPKFDRIVRVKLVLSSTAARVKRLQGVINTLREKQLEIQSEMERLQSGNDASTSST